VFLGNIKLAFERNPDLKSLLMDDFFRQAVGTCQESWRDVIATAAQYGVPVPAFSTALSFYDAYRCQRLPANLIQVHFYSLFPQRNSLTITSTFIVMNSRLSAITLAHTPMSCWISQVCFTTQTGPVTEEGLLLLHTKPKLSQNQKFMQTRNFIRS
jgi:hypothetical protein